MFQFLNKYGQGLAFGLGSLFVILFLWSMSSDGGKGLLTPETVGESSATGMGGMLVIGLIFLAVTSMLVFSVFNNLHSPIRAGISGILTLGWLYAFFGKIVPTLFNKMEASTEPLLANGLTAGQDSLVSMGINLTLGMIAIAFLSLIGSLVFNAIKG